MVLNQLGASPMEEKMFKLIWIVLGYVVDSGGTTIDVTTSVGLAKNLTFYVIDDDTTWYTAREACQQEIPESKFQFCGNGCSQYVVRKIIELNLITSSHVWIGKIKEWDDTVYDAYTCTKTGTMTQELRKIGGINGLTQCVVLDMISQSIGLDDCNNNHPFICLVKETEISERPKYYNTSLHHNTDVEEKITPNINKDRCQKMCDWWYLCVGYIFNFDALTCTHLADSYSFNAYSTPLVTVTEDQSSYTVFEAKHSPRVSIKKLIPSKSRTSQYSPKFHCRLPQTTVTPNSTCYCYCNESKSSENVTKAELEQWIKNITDILVLNKKKLSSYTRRLNSADDPRPSSTACGVVAAFLLAAVITFITFGDILKYIGLLYKRLLNQLKLHNE